MPEDSRISTSPRLEGPPPRWADVKASIFALRTRAVVAVSLSLAPCGGKLFWLATGEDGAVTPLDASGNMAAIGVPDLVEAATRLAGAVGTAVQGFLDDGDSY